MKVAPEPAKVRSSVSAVASTTSAEGVTLGAYAKSEAPSISNAVTYSSTSAAPSVTVASVPVFCVALSTT